MNKLYTITKRDTIKAGIANFIKTHIDNKYGWRYVATQLQELDPNTVSAEEASEVFNHYKDGTSGRTRGISSGVTLTCDVCKQDVEEVVHVGDEPYYEARYARVCKRCVVKAIALFKE